MDKNNDVKFLLGKQIKEVRNKKGLTQEKLAELIGVGERNLSKIECGVNFVTADTLSKLLFALNIDAKELFDYEHHKNRETLKKELIDGLNENKIDVELLYKIYKALK